MTEPPNPTGVRLENLTGHDIVLDVVQPAPARRVSAPVGPAVTIPPAGGMARVVEHRLGEGSLLTEYGTVRAVVLGRSEDVEGLPPEHAGVVYVVPRLTALAARHRSDLVFPHEERRDTRGIVVGAAALGRFPPTRRRLQLPSIAPRRWSDVGTVTRWLGPVFVVATALLGGALGVLPGVIAGDPRAPDFWPRLWTGSAVFVVGCAALWFGIGLWRRRERLLHQRGTAYLLDELAESWTYEEKESFVADLSSEFAKVLRVPGPSALGEAWHWPLETGAERWAEKTDELVRAFWAVHFNDDQVTHNAVFVWAWWPVAVSLPRARPRAAEG